MNQFSGACELADHLAFMGVEMINVSYSCNNTCKGAHDKHQHALVPLLIWYLLL